MKNLPEPGLELYDTPYLIDLIERASAILNDRGLDPEGRFWIDGEPYSE
jgi:hypothetical protein